MLTRLKLTAIRDRLDTLLATLQGTSGTAGLLLNDRQLYDNLNRTLTELQTLIVDRHGVRLDGASIGSRSLKGTP